MTGVQTCALPISVSFHRIREASKQVSNGVGTGAVQVAGFAREVTAAWRYISATPNDQEFCTLPTEWGGSSSTGYRSAVYFDAASVTGLREWLSGGSLFNGSLAGLACLTGGNGLGNGYWYIAARSSASGATRCEGGASRHIGDRVPL